MSDSTICHRIEAVFHELFLVDFNTRLIGGAGEPVYIPAGEASFNRIYYYLDYPRSAFHEVAHWCVAGPVRRTQPDYGYWYKPDGRTASEQTEFERVEVRPQAFEWIFCKAAGLKFSVSRDNLSGEISETEREFKENVLAQVVTYMNNGLPERANKFAWALRNEFSPGAILDAGQFSLEELG